MHFRENQARNRKNNSAEKMPIVRHMLLDLLKKRQTVDKKRVSVRSEGLLAG
jgi:predicted transposase YbfD/YdcC